MNIYVIVDRASKKMFSQYIQCPDDMVAVFGFNNWLKSLEHEEKIATNPAMYALYCVGKCEESGKIVSMNSYHVVNGDNADELYKQLLESAIADAVENDEL